MTDLMRAAMAWLIDDPDPDTSAELADLMAKVQVGVPGAADDLADRFRGRLQFGTAGLRGALGAGPNRMNRVTVIRAAAGLAAHLHNIGGSTVIVGYDARHKSEQFALDTCAVMVAAGIHARIMPRALPTPLVPFAIRYFGADAGVVVTASHNPPEDNGYKVFLGDGSQIVPPSDAEISACIDAVGPVAKVPMAASGWEVLDDSIVEAYITRAVGVVDPTSARAVTSVYTPLHGVGRDTLLAAFARAGFPAPAVVPLQSDPDPDFPTVAFPNPEEPGAIDLALDLAEQQGVDVVIANDPDADRCAAAARFPADPAAGHPEPWWRMLRGDELGAILGWHLLRRGLPAGSTFANSIVSSTLLGAIATSNGMRHVETLTGFKWIGRVPDLRFGYEEALGYCVDPTAVADKDGISAALLVAEFVAGLRAEGRTLADALDDIAREYGHYATDQLSVRVDRLEIIAEGMAALRSTPPTSLGGLAVTRLDDLAAGSADLPPTDGLRFTLAPVAGDRTARVIARPSGTEPKLKCYIEVPVPVVDGDLAAARATGARVIEAIKADLRRALGLAH